MFKHDSFRLEIDWKMSLLTSLSHRRLISVISFLQNWSMQKTRKALVWIWGAHDISLNLRNYIHSFTIQNTKLIVDQARVFGFLHFIHTVFVVLLHVFGIKSSTTDATQNSWCIWLSHCFVNFTPFLCQLNMVVLYYFYLVFEWKLVHHFAKVQFFCF